MDKLVPITVKCPKCRQSLMNEDKLLMDKASVELDIKYKGDKGKLWLCQFYGCQEKELSLDVPDGGVADIYCPHCGEDLATNVLCEACDAPMITFGITTGGKVSICSRKGCSKHYVAFQNLDDVVRRFHEEFDSY